MTDPALAAVALAKPFVSKLVEALLKPAIKTVQGITDPIMDVFGNRFSEYLSRQLVKHSYLPTIVFQVRQPLEDIYIPLTVVEESSFDHSAQRKSFLLDKYSQEFLPKRERILVIDSAGMGKTTLSRFLFVQSIKTLSTVPIFIELRHLSTEKLIIDYILSELNSLPIEKELKIDRRQILRLLEKGVFTFFMDGYDEIGSTHREQVTRDIKSLTENFPKNKFLITSRPEHALASFPSFQAFRIRSLKKEEAFTLIRKYDRGGEKGEKLISRLSDKSLPEASEFLENPLLTTLLYRAYDYKAQIPLKKPNFYRQVFDALFEWHDLTKDGYSTREKISKLDIDGFHKILRGIGFICVLRGRVEADTDEMLEWIREAKGYAPELKFSEHDFLEDAIKAVPIFRREGNAIIWSHKSLAEYFCAQFIVSDAKADQQRICEHIAASLNLSYFYNLLDLLYDMDIVLFSTHFIKPLLAMFAAEHERIKRLFPGISAPDLELRVAVTFGERPFILSDGRNVTPVIKSRIKAISDAAMREWYGLEPVFDTDSLVDNRLQLGVIHDDSRRVLSLGHALKTVFSILVEKKHRLVTRRGLYPAHFKRTPILGTRDGQGLPLNETPNATWNNAKNFSRTSITMAVGSPGIFNPQRIEPTLREIEQMSGKSATTASLLSALGRT